MDFDPVIKQDAIDYLSLGGSAFENCAIVGVTGLLGSYLLDFISQVNLLTGSNTALLGFSRSLTPHVRSVAMRQGVGVHPLDHLERETVKFENVNLIHSASPASFSNVQSDPYSLLESNILLTQRIFKILEQTSGRLTFFSSGEVYGNFPAIPTGESDYSGFDHLSSRGYYPEVKRFSETMSRLWSEQNGIPVTILRIFHTFGPGVSRNDTRIFASAIFNVTSKENIELTSDGSARRSFLYTLDLAQVFQHTWTKNGFEVFNVCGEPELSVLEFAKLVSLNREGCAVTTNTNFQTAPDTESPIRRGIADTSKLRGLGWSPRVEIQSAIQRTIESVQWRESKKWN
jgi:nucleoside-diphosphate-sugar epimerase